jgi:DNA-binding SARP family transcriptional activator/tetratricopeptide (TPR) repeat protein
MESPRYLRCLGLPGFFTPGGDPVRFRTKKHLALLVYLAVESRRFHSRDNLAELLWPGARTAEARHSLATALSVLRPRLGGEALQSTREQVMLAAGHVRLDLERLLAGDVLGSEVTSPLDVANFLDGFEIPDAREFTLWKDRQQARLLPAIKDALVVLIDRCRRTGDSRQIEQLADRMLVLDELSEEAIRAKMEARTYAADRVGALKIYEEWKGRLAGELGAAPSDLLEGMAMRLRRRGWERTPIAEIPSAPADQTRGRPFIGRTSEYQVLYEAWEGLRKGCPAHALILGDSGIGKSTLVMRLTTAAGLEGAVISRVQSYDLERDIPYSTLGSLIQGLLDRPGVSGTPPEALAEIGRTVPEVRRRFPGLPDSADSQGETARVRLTEAFHEMLTTIVDEHPVILVVDDLHLADDASLAVLHLVMRRSRGQAIMVLLIARPGELVNSPQAARLRDSGESLGIREIELGPLSAEESADLLSALVPSDEPQPSTSARRALLRAAGGFPMVLELLTQDWQANGEQSLALSIDAMTTDLEGGAGPTAAYRHIIGRIVRSLDQQTHSVLSLAAVLGHRLNDLTMYGLIDMSFGQTMAGLSELSARRVLRDGSEGLEFVNELVRASAYAAVPSSLRRALHSSVVDRLLSDEHDAVPGLEIAWHCFRSGRDGEATPYLLNGAREAIRNGAPDVAEHALSSALPSLKVPEATEARFLLVEVLQEQGRWLESLDMLSSLDPNLDAERKDEMLVFAALAKTYLGASTAREMFERLPELIEVIQNATRARTRARAARVVAYLVMMSGNQQSCKGLLKIVNKITEEDLDPESVAHLALARVVLSYESGLATQSARLAEAAITKLRGLGVANLLMGQLHCAFGTINARRGSYETAIPHQEKAFKTGMRLGNDTLIRVSAANIAFSYYRLGRYDDQLKWIEQVPNARNAEFIGQIEMEIAYVAALGQLHNGRRQRAEAAMQALEDKLDVNVAWSLQQLWALYRADVLWVGGRPSEALRIAKLGLERSNYELLSTAWAGPFARWVALTDQNNGKRQMGRSVLEDLLRTLDNYDAMDQAEILSARITMNTRDGILDSSLEPRLLERLGDLPAAARTHLAILLENQVGA